MARFLKSKREEIGLSPDALHFRGERKSDKVLLTVIDYDSENLCEVSAENVEEVLHYKNSQTTTWVNVYGLHDEKIMQEISSGFELQSLILSDVMDTHARPKLHEYDNCIYISLKMLVYNEKTNFISSENLVIIIKKDILISFQEKKGDFFEPLRDRIRKSKRRIRTLGTDYLAFAIIDIVFDNYKYIISRIGDKIESLEERLLSKPTKSFLVDFDKFKREIIFLNKSIKPCRDITLELLKMESEFLNDYLEVHLKELNDNINHSIESAESYREILVDQLNIYHTTVSSTLNDVMKFLTVFSVIFIPLTFIAGVYGTNFEYFPEIHFKYGYFMMWGAMILIAVSMIIYFKWKKWM